MAYQVTIQRERGEYVARDRNGDWRAHVAADRELRGQELAEYLFHREELGKVWSDSVATYAVILENDECQTN